MIRPLINGSTKELSKPDKTATVGPHEDKTSEIGPSIAYFQIVSVDVTLPGKSLRFGRYLVRNSQKTSRTHEWVKLIIIIIIIIMIFVFQISGCQTAP